MANEFRVRKGLVINGSGSTILDVQGSQGQLFSVTDSLSGSLFAVKDISGIPILEVFSNNEVKMGTFNAEAIKVTGSLARVTGSFTGSFTGSLFGSSSNALTASSADSFVVRNNITASNALISSTITAQTLVVQTITSSITYSSGSNIFGSLLTNTQQLTGSVDITGSLDMTGSLRVTSSATHFINGANVGIGTSVPIYTLDVNGSGDFSNNLFVSGSFRTTGSVNITGSIGATGSVIITGSLIATTNIFSKGGSVADYGGGITTDQYYYVWRAPFNCTATALFGRRNGGTTAIVNARKSGSGGYSNLLAANLTLTTANFWTSGGTLQNTSFVTGDSLEILISGSTGSPNQVGVQVDFVKV